MTIGISMVIGQFSILISKQLLLTAPHFDAIRETRIGRGSGSMFKKILSFISAWILISFVAVTGRAQGPTATISGVVRDQTGAVLPGVSIQVINSETGTVRMTITDEAGRYRVPALDSGTYAVEGTLTGFRKV